VQIAAVIVTYNRRFLLERCLVALSKQNHEIQKIFIVDNASTDDTPAWLQLWLPVNLPQSALISLPENTGGAGGFATGLRTATEDGFDWIWMMDDDAEPYPDALTELMKIAVNPENIYGSLAIQDDETAWETTLLDPPGGRIRKADVIPIQAEVEMLPLLGLLVHRDLVGKIGVPDSDFFIAGDDAEYCVRARRAGAKVIVASQSRIEHPKASIAHIFLFGQQISYLSLPPWKRYYDTRNRLLIARKHYGLRLLTHTLPGSMVRLFTALRRESNKRMQARSFFAGLFDGLLGIKGKRHEKWGIKP